MKNDKKIYYEFIRTIKVSPQSRMDGTDYISEYCDKINIYIYQEICSKDIVVKLLFRCNNSKYDACYDLTYDEAHLDSASSAGEYRIVFGNNIISVLERYLSSLKQIDASYHLSGLELYDKNYKEIIFGSSSMFSNYILNAHEDNLFKYSGIRLLTEIYKINVFCRSE